MIKRNGVEIMNQRTNNVKIAKETLEVLKQKQYASHDGRMVNIADSLDAAINGTILYKDPLPNKNYAAIMPTLEVVNHTTTFASGTLEAQGKTNIVALNFASARNPGGGFLGGAIAQEEDLCRSSGLYACVKSKPIFYNENILCDNTLYTDGIIYSPNVPFFRSENSFFLEEPYLLSIITAPAPNVQAFKNVDEDLLYSTLLYRSIKILQIAEAHGHKTIVLGAWGCGAFGNDPVMVADAFMAALQEVPTFEHVCFAVYDTRPETPVYEAFKKVVLQ